MPSVARDLTRPPFGREFPRRGLRRPFLVGWGFRARNGDRAGHPPSRPIFESAAICPTGNHAPLGAGWSCASASGAPVGALAEGDIIVRMLQTTRVRLGAWAAVVSVLIPTQAFAQTQTE